MSAATNKIKSNSGVKIGDDALDAAVQWTVRAEEAVYSDSDSRVLAACSLDDSCAVRRILTVCPAGEWGVEAAQAAFALGVRCGDGVLLRGVLKGTVGDTIPQSSVEGVFRDSLSLCDVRVASAVYDSCPLPVAGSQVYKRLIEALYAGGSSGLLEACLVAAKELKTPPPVTEADGFRLACARGNAGVVRARVARQTKGDVDDGFVEAARAGQLGIIRILLQLAMQECVCFQNSYTRALVACAANGQLSALQWLLRVEGPLPLADGSDFTEALVAAVRSHNVSVVKVLLAVTGENSVDVHARVEYGTTSVFAAACHAGDARIVAELLALAGDRYIDVHAHGGEAFISACQCTTGSVEVLDLLLGLRGERYIDVHVRDEQGFIEACSCGHVNTVRRLLSLTGERRIDVHAQDGRAFRTACLASGSDTVLELLSLNGDRAIEVHKCCPHALVYATNRDREWVKVVRALLARRGAQSLDVQSDGDCTPLLSACKRGLLAIVLELLSLKGAQTLDVHAENEGAFRNACANGHIAVVKELLALGGDRQVDVRARAHHGGGRLFDGFAHAVEGGHLDIVRLLLALPAERRPDVKGENELALRLALSKGREDIVDILLWLGGDDETCLWALSPSADLCVLIGKSAADSGRLSLVKTVLGIAQRLLHVRRGMLESACRRRHEALVRFMLDQREPSPRPHVVDEDVFAAACEHGDLAIVRLLLEDMSKDRSEDLATYQAGLAAACEHGRLDVVQELLALGGARQVDANADDGLCFALACESDHLGVVQELLALKRERQVDVSIRDYDCFTCACASGSVTVVQELLALTGDRAVDLGIVGQDALKEAFRRDRLDVVHLLLGLEGDRALLPDIIRIAGMLAIIDPARFTEPIPRMCLLLGLRGDRVLKDPAGKALDERAVNQIVTLLCEQMPQAFDEWDEYDEEDDSPYSWRNTLTAMAAPGGILQHPEAHPRLQAAAREGYRYCRWASRRRLVRARVAARAAVPGPAARGRRSKRARSS